MVRIRALIVDDEPIARRGIRAQLESRPAIEVVGKLRRTPASIPLMLAVASLARSSSKPNEL